MIIKTHGDARLPKILGLHPMMASGESMLRLAGSMRERYCVIAPDLTGQGEDTGTFVSAEAEARTLHDWLLDKGWTRLELIYGASLGASVALELMAMPDLEVGTAVFDGCPLYKNAPFLKWMMTTVFLKKRRKAARVPELADQRMTQMYGPLFGPEMAKSFLRMSEDSIRGIVAACSRCSFHRYPETLERRMHFEYGEKDMDLKEAKKNLPRYYPKATLTVREGYGHCQYLSSMGEAYSGVLEQYIHE